MTALALVESGQLDKELPWWLYDLLDDDTEDRRFWITKGLGAGGTYGLAMWHYLMCQINYRAKFSWSIAPTYQQVQDTLIPTFSEVLQLEFGLEEGTDFEIITSGRPRILLKEFGQEIHFKSANRPDRMVGPSISHISGTEVGLWPRMAYEKSSARLRSPRAARLQYLGEGTPEGFNWWEQEANFEEGVDEARNYRRVRLETSDNTRLKPGYVEQLRRTYSYDPAKLESYLYGRFVAFTKGTAYWEFFESRNVVIGVQPDPHLDILMNWDFGTSPLPWTALQRQPFERHRARRHRFVLLAEGSGQARGLDDACAEFVVTFPPEKYYHTPIKIYGGHDGYFGSHLSPNCAYDQIQRFLKRHYANVQVCASRTAPLVKDRLERVNQLFNYELFVIAAWCRNSIKSFAETTLKAGTWNLEKQPDKDYSHFSDTVGDALFNLTKGEDFAQPHKKKIYGINKTL